MVKKTIGGFIATLRKANGMTQKDLAELLNVSEKISTVGNVMMVRRICL